MTIFAKIWEKELERIISDFENVIYSEKNKNDSSSKFDFELTIQYTSTDLIHPIHLPEDDMSLDLTFDKTETETEPIDSKSMVMVVEDHPLIQNMC